MLNEAISLFWILLKSNFILLYVASVSSIVLEENNCKKREKICVEHLQWHSSGGDVYASYIICDVVHISLQGKKKDFLGVFRSVSSSSSSNTPRYLVYSIKCVIIMEEAREKERISRIEIN